jgi:hypothetical protein
MAIEGLTSNPQAFFKEALRKNLSDRLNPPSHTALKPGGKHEKLFSQEQKIPASKCIPRFSLFFMLIFLNFLSQTNFYNHLATKAEGFS